MQPLIPILASSLALTTISGCGSDKAPPPTPSEDGGTGEADGATVILGLDAPYDPSMSFFVTSRGGPKGGDFRLAEEDADGLAGADAFCKELAAAQNPDFGKKTWRAYLSTSTVDARSRIGDGPWYNAQMTIIAEDLAQLHDEGGLMNNLVINEYQNALDEKGEEVPLDRHDILTGTTVDGRKDPEGKHCNNWTSTMGEAIVGHADRKGGDSSSWNSVHSVGCGPAPMMDADLGNRAEGTVTSGGGRGSIFCFALPLPPAAP